jgi:hypothetical protein
MRLKKYIYYTCSLSSTHLWLRCSNFFNPSTKILLVVLQIGKAKDLSAPLYTIFSVPPTNKTWKLTAKKYLVQNSTIIIIIIIKQSYIIQLFLEYDSFDGLGPSFLTFFWQHSKITGYKEFYEMGIWTWTVRTCRLRGHLGIFLSTNYSYAPQKGLKRTMKTYVSGILAKIQTRQMLNASPDGIWGSQWCILRLWRSRIWCHVVW